MSLFRKIKDVAEKRKVIAEFLSNRKILRQRLIDEKISKQELATATERVQRPVTEAVEKAQKQTDEKQDKFIERLRENQESITGAIDSLSEAVTKAGSTVPPEVKSYLEKSPDPTFQFDDVDLSALSLADEKRIKAIGFDETFVNIPSREEIQAKFVELEDKLFYATTERNVKIIENQLESLQKYQGLIDKRKQPEASPPSKIILSPFWFAPKTDSTLRSLGIDPSFAKVPTYEDLDIAFRSYNSTLKKF